MCFRVPNKMIVIASGAKRYYSGPMPGLPCRFAPRNCILTGDNMTIGRKGQNNITAFTLVELLVVIAIIALLLSILMPALKKAREQAKTVICAANVHNIGLALFLYTNSNKDTFPPKWSWSAPVQDPFQITLFKYLGNTAGAFKCPAAIGPIYSMWESEDGPPTPFWTSYGINTAINNVKVQDVKRPSSVIVIADTMLAATWFPKIQARTAGDLNVWGPYWMPAFKASVIADWHYGSANILFADQSASRHPSKEQYPGERLYEGWWPKGRR